MIIIDISESMRRKSEYLSTAICVLLLSIASVTALEEFSNPEGTFMKIESQEELFNVVSELNLSSTNPVYLVLPRLAEPTVGKCVGCRNSIDPRTTCDCCFHCITYDGHNEGSTCPSPHPGCKATKGCCANSNNCLYHC